MPDKEATARIKINRLLEAAGWRFFADGNGPVNIRLEPSVAITPAELDSLEWTLRGPGAVSSTSFCSTRADSR
jgi:hypothetical protein